MNRGFLKASPVIITTKTFTFSPALVCNCDHAALASQPLTPTRVASSAPPQLGRSPVVHPRRPADTFEHRGLQKASPLVSLYPASLQSGVA